MSVSFARFIAVINAWADVSGRVLSIAGYEEEYVVKWANVSCEGIGKLVKDSFCEEGTGVHSIHADKLLRFMATEFERLKEVVTNPKGPPIP